MTIFAKMAAGYGLVGSFIIVAVTTFLGYKLAELIGQKRMGSAFAILLALVIGSTGCALDDLLAPFAGDIPFEQDETMPSEMGAVDNIPTVPEDDSAMDTFRPLT